MEKRTGSTRVFSAVYDYKEDSVVVSNEMPGKGTLVTRCVDDPAIGALV